MKTAVGFSVSVLWMRDLVGNGTQILRIMRIFRIKNLCSSVKSASSAFYFPVFVLWMREGGENGRLLPVSVLWMRGGRENGRLFPVSILWMREDGENGRFLPMSVL